MRIGEFADSVAGELAARRNAIAAELPRLGAKLTEPPIAVRPAVPLADAVRISAEARAAHLGKHEAEFPKPSAITAALAAVLGAGSPAEEGVTVQRLVALVQIIEQSIPPVPVDMPTGTPSPAAEMLARAILNLDAADAPESLAQLVRQLAAEAAGYRGTAGSAPSVAMLERASVALLLASLGAASVSESPSAFSVQRQQELPPELLSFAAGGSARVRRRRSKADKEEPAGEEARWLDEEDGNADGPTYRSIPLRK